MDTQYQLKLDMYEAGAYRMPVPPVPTTYWSTRDWINFIDAQGVWTFNGCRITDATRLLIA